jgi:hypothetical protein
MICHLNGGTGSNSGDGLTGRVPPHAPRLWQKALSLCSERHRPALDGLDRPPATLSWTIEAVDLFPAEEHMGRGVAVRHADKKPRPAPKFTHNLTGSTKDTKASEGSLVDIAHGEWVEKELDILIERRSRKGEVDPHEEEELWKESVRQYNVRRREDNPLAWQSYLWRLAGSLRARAEEYDRRAALLEDRGEGTR